MKKVLYFIVAVLTSISMVSCEKEQHAENLKVQYYADFELTGGQEYILPIGTTWVEPGFKATVRGVDVTDQIEVNDEVVDSLLGAYSVKYTYVTPDGFPNSIVRTVYVCNPAVTTDLSGTYTTISGTYRDSDGSIKEYPGYKVKIKKICPGFFTIDDILAQFYSEYYGYAAAYPGWDFCGASNLSLNEENTIDFISGGWVEGFDESVTDFTGGVYDPATKTISYVATWGEMDFHVVIAKD